jgi:hypothetical protein
MKPNESKIIVHGARHRARIPYLKNLVEVVSERKITCPFRGFNSTNTFYILLVRPRSDKPAVPSTQPSIVSKSKSFFKGRDSAIDQYKRLELTIDCLVSKDQTSRHTRVGQNRTIEGKEVDDYFEVKNQPIEFG